MPELAVFKVIGLDDRVGRTGRVLDAAQFADNGPGESRLSGPEVSGQEDRIAGLKSPGEPEGQRLRCRQIGQGNSVGITHGLRLAKPARHGKR